MRKKTFAMVLLAVAICLSSRAQDTTKRKTDTTKKVLKTNTGMPGAISKAEPKPYATVITAKTLTQKGMITSHKIEDKYYFEIPDSVLGRDILIVSRISKGATTSGYAGDVIGSRVVRFEKGPNNRIFMRKISFSMYSSDSTKDMYQNLERSNVQPIVAAFNIEAFSLSKNGSVIDMTTYLNQDNDIFFFENKGPFKVGGFQSDKSYVVNVRSFPMNVELTTVKTYSAGGGGLNPFAGMPTSAETPGGSGLTTLELNTSMVLLPAVPMKSRYYDPRVGYFTVGYTDFDANPQGVQEISLIKRWRLEPKPGDMGKYRRGILVEPAKQIVFYIDPATPKKWVPYLIAGVNDWQKAFEKAGFKNAIIAKVAPTAKEDSTWSLDDARHSAIVYKPSNIPNASGPSIADPRSGEIMESHVNWYHNVMKLVHDWYMIQTAAVDPRARKMTFSDALMGDLIRFVSSHEIGHTLGLLHNYGSSSTVDVEKLRNKSWVEANGHTPSIMDYARFNYVAQPEDHISSKGLYPRIGDYDKWAIEWGYKLLPDLKGGESELAKLNKMTIESAKNPRLWFGTEQDSNDPRAQNEDLGNNAMKASTYGIKNLKVILKSLPEWTKEDNHGYENLKNMYNELVNQFGRYMGHVAKNIGGIMTTPKTVEQPGEIVVRTSAATQKEAMAFLNENLFKTPLWLFDKGISDKIGQNPITIVSRLQMIVFDLLLSHNTFSKLISAEAMDGQDAYKATDLLDELNMDIFSELKTNQPIDVYRRNLQKVYVEELIQLINPAPAAQSSSKSSSGNASPRSLETNDIPSIVKSQLKKMEVDINAAKATASGMSKSHLEDISERIAKTLDVKK